MIIVTATMHPHGSPAGAYELLHATIANRTSPGDARESYFSHVLARPRVDRGIRGYEADVETVGHQYELGFAPLLSSVLIAAHGGLGLHRAGGFMPASRTLACVTIEQAADFEKVLRGRA